jgi:2-keto-4-pentenoate hydratase/2-oxohepta-3-ene-1,7-dioic acid hydratase in catechol pathway
MTSAHVTRFVRYGSDEGPRYGIVEGDTIFELEGEILGEWRRTGRTVSRLQVKLLLPFEPRRVGKILGIVVNYHPPGQPPSVLGHPRFFTKFSTSLSPHGGEVETPPDATNLNYEGELVAVIGRECRHVSVEDAPNYVWGVGVGNDFSENTWVAARNGPGSQGTLLAKVPETWAALYHTVVTGLDYSNLRIEVRLNGEVVAAAQTQDMIYSTARQISYLSHFMTLLPGDLIYTGAAPVIPGKRRQLGVGDVVEVEIEGIGCLLSRLVPMKGSHTQLPIRAAY